MNRFRADALLFTFALKLGSGQAEGKIAWKGQLEAEVSYSTVSHHVLSLDKA